MLFISCTRTLFDVISVGYLFAFCVYDIVSCSGRNGWNFGNVNSLRLIQLHFSFVQAT